MKKNLQNKTFFDYGEYKHLFSVISASKDEFAKDDLEAVDDALSQCRRYVEVVDATEQQIMFAQLRFEGTEYREKIMQYDKTRKNAHESAIVSVNMLNRISANYNCQKIYSGSSDRLEVADFCLEVVVTLFENRRK